MYKSTPFRFSAIVLLALLCWGGGMQAQQAITSFGGDATSITGSLSYSGGEIAVKTAYAPAITVVNVTESFSEGVQQPLTARDVQYQGIDALNVSVALYPNPTADNVILECDQPTQLSYTLYNTNGQMLSRGTYQGGQQTIDLQQYAVGTYMLHITTPDQSKKNIYKIIKAK
ncbi:MAG: T9SS type A sorting domain-containing protein [Bacteroidales bacterium]|nr:T9SS type A sorting domain-containing protein [Bacteroidales bacterium]